MGKAVCEEGRVFVGFEGRQIQAHSKQDAVSTHTTVCWNNTYCSALYLAFYYISSIRETWKEIKWAEKVCEYIVDGERSNCAQPVL